MTKFLELTYYNNRDFIFPNHLKPSSKKISLGTQNYYTSLSKSEYGIKLFNEFHNDNDVDLMENLIHEHGIFFEKFLAAKFRHRINLFFSDDENSKYLIGYCRVHYDTKESKNSLIGRIKSDFLKISLILLMNEPLFKKLKESEIEKSKIRNCAICNRPFQPFKLPDWVYYGSNGNDTICFECPVNRNPKKQDLKLLIGELVDTLKFIPNANFNPINHNFSSRVNKDQWVDVCKIIFKMGIQGNDTLNSKSIVNRKFGSWFKALVESEVLPNGILETPRGYRCISINGNECNSLDEMFVDNWLFQNNITAIKEPIYPKHPIYNKLGRRRADWKVNDYYIEYFGLKGEEEYDKKTKEKLLLAKDLGLKLISIFPSDLKDLSEKLTPLL